MLLVLTNSKDVTADYLISVLDQRGVRLVRFDTDTLVSAVRVSYQPGDPAIQVGGQWYTPADFGNVWYRRPERLRDSRFPDSGEGKSVLDEWTEALEGFFAHIPFARWMNHASANALASHKLQQLSAATSIGFRVPDTILTQDSAILREFSERHGGRIVVKPMASGYVERPDGEADSLIFTNLVTPEHLNRLDDLSSCPTLFQEYIEKHSDVRITAVDGEYHPVELIAREGTGQQRCDIRRNNMLDVSYCTIALPTDVEGRLRKLLELYRLRFAAIDMVISTAGEWYFLEVNPNGQWAWLDLTAGTNIADAFVRAFSADRT